MRATLRKARFAPVGICTPLEIVAAAVQGEAVAILLGISAIARLLDELLELIHRYLAAHHGKALHGHAVLRTFVIIASHLVRQRTHEKRTTFDHHHLRPTCCIELARRLRFDAQSVHFLE